jgi:hypothetical protein
MSDHLSSLIERIESRPAIELKATIQEFARLFPNVDGTPVIQIVECHKDIDGIGNVLMTYAKVIDPLSGPREIILHVWKYDRTQRNPLGKGKLDRYSEISDDSTGGPLFNPEPAKRAVLECLRTLATVTPTPPDPDDPERQRALGLWNEGKSWPEVNATLGRPVEGTKATTQEIKRFANRTKQYIRKGKPGVKSTN